MDYKPYDGPAPFSETSKERLRGCHPKLIALFNEVANRGFDCSITCGHRGEEDQNKAFDDGFSQLKWPESRHNSTPSNAVDAGPYIKGQGIPWDEDKHWLVFAGAVMAVAKDLDISVEWGGHWDSFKDYPHWQLS